VDNQLKIIFENLIYYFFHLMILLQIGLNTTRNIKTSFGYAIQ